MALININDNSNKAKGDCSLIEPLINRIVNKTLKKLEEEGIFVFPEILKDSEDITKNQIIVKEIDNCYCTGNVMGFIGYEDKRLIIGSRFAESKDSDYFFQYILNKVLEFPNIVDLKTDANQDEKLFNYLIFIFPYLLKRAMRKGIYKVYENHEYNDNNIKGTIDFARHIKLNTPFIGNIAYNQREFTRDNKLMELIRHTIEFIKIKSYGTVVLSKVKDEVKRVIEITNAYNYYDRNKIIDYNLRKRLRHAYYKEYIELQQLCLLILQYRKHQLGYGNKRIYGILFDGAWMWEEYVNTIIKDKFYHPMNKGSKYPQELFCDENEKQSGLIYPDFIGKDIQNRIIADAKYKPVDHIRNKDYLQVLAYMYRFDSKEGYYIYPDNRKGGQTRYELLQGAKFNTEKSVKSRQDKIVVVKYGFKIPQNSVDYKSFERSIAESEDKLQKEFGIG